jgi:hypothetical protein
MALPSNAVFFIEARMIAVFFSTLSWLAGFFLTHIMIAA